MAKTCFILNPTAGPSQRHDMPALIAQLLWRAGGRLRNPADGTRGPRRGAGQQRPPPKVSRWWQPLGAMAP
ncbi:MAG: hypothetical protein WKG07_28935 [Hymenobacter sp.]